MENIPPDAQGQLENELIAYLENLSPEEQAVLEQQAMEQFENLSPSRRAELEQAVRTQLDALPPDIRAEFEQGIKEYLENNSPGAEPENLYSSGDNINNFYDFLYRLLDNAPAPEWRPEAEWDEELHDLYIADSVGSPGVDNTIEAGSLRGELEWGTEWTAQWDGRRENIPLTTVFKLEPKLKAWLEIGEQSDIGVSAEVVGFFGTNFEVYENLSFKKDLGSRSHWFWHLLPFPPFIVWVELRGTLYAGFETHVFDGGLEGFVCAAARPYAALSWQGGFQSGVDTWSCYNFEVEQGTDLTIRPYVGARISALIYSLVGPYLEVEPSLNGRLYPGENLDLLNFKVDAEVTGNIGLESFLGKHLETEIFNLSELIWDTSFQLGENEEYFHIKDITTLPDWVPAHPTFLTFENKDEPKPGEPISFEGRLFAETGDGISGVPVTIYRKNNPATEYIEIVRENIGSVTTGPSGVFNFSTTLPSTPGEYFYYTEFWGGTYSIPYLGSVTLMPSESSKVRTRVGHFISSSQDIFDLATIEGNNTVGENYIIATWDRWGGKVSDWKNIYVGAHVGVPENLIINTSEGEFIVFRRGSLERPGGKISVNALKITLNGPISTNSYYGYPGGSILAAAQDHIILDASVSARGEGSAQGGTIIIRYGSVSFGEQFGVDAGPGGRMAFELLRLPDEMNELELKSVEDVYNNATVYNDYFGNVKTYTVRAGRIKVIGEFMFPGNLVLEAQEFSVSYGNSLNVGSSILFVGGRDVVADSGASMSANNTDGGFISITADNLIAAGSISANGLDSSAGRAGTIVVTASELCTSGSISARGGTEGSGATGGSGGTIAITSTSAAIGGSISVDGGDQLHSYVGNGGNGGSITIGSDYLSTSASLSAKGGYGAYYGGPGMGGTITIYYGRITTEPAFNYVVTSGGEVDFIPLWEPGRGLDLELLSLGDLLNNVVYDDDNRTYTLWAKNVRVTSELALPANVVFNVEENFEVPSGGWIEVGASWPWIVDSYSITMNANEVVIAGSISANGLDSSAGRAGTIVVTASELCTSGSISARGGTEGSGATGGSGGTIAITSTSAAIGGSISVDGGDQLHSYVGNGGNGGSITIGSDYLSTSASLSAKGGYGAYYGGPGMGGTITIYYGRIIPDESAIRAGSNVDPSGQITFTHVDIFPFDGYLIIDNTPTLYLPPIPGAVSYTLQYSTDPTFGTTTIEGITEQTYTVPDENALADRIYYWRFRTVDQAGRASDWSSAWWFEVSADRMPPVSSVDAITLYWHNELPITVTATAADDKSGVAGVALWYRYSADNTTWSEWLEFGVDNGEPWSWSFGAPSGDGCYEFYTISVDQVGNVESAPETADVLAGVDTTPPESSVGQVAPYWQNATMVPFTVNVTASDALSGVENVELWYRYSSDNSTWSSWTLYGVDVALSQSWSFDAPGGDGYYEFYSVATDASGNIEGTLVIEGLIGHWSFDEGASSTARDSSGSGNDGTIYGASWVDDGKVGKALSFGVDDRVVVPASSSLNVGNLTFTLWIKPYSYPSGHNMHIFGRWAELYVMYISPSGYLYFQSIAGGQIRTTSQIPLNEWTHVAATWKADAFRLYLNGQEDYIITSSYSGDFPASSQALWFGNEEFDGGRNVGWYNGLLDEIRLYNRALSPEEIQAICGVQGLVEADARCGVDTASESSVNPIEPYWQTSTPFAVTVTASDALSGVSGVELYYRHSPDNSTWGPWTEFVAGNDGSWDWEFDAPEGDGYYEFYSVAVDIAGNVEATPEQADVQVALDTTPPTSIVDSTEPYWQNASMLPFEMTATASDAMSGVASVELFYRYSVDNVTFWPWTSYGVSDASPWSWSFDAPDGDGFYELYSVAVDRALNREEAPDVADASAGVDTISPESSVDELAPYWQNAGMVPFTVSVTASDATSGVESVELFYRYSPDNSTWDSWTLHDTDVISPWSWSFNVPECDGYYEFASVARDAAGNVELFGQVSVDEFAGTSLDTTAWSTGRVRVKYDNIAVSDGKLQLTARADNVGTYGANYVVSNSPWDFSQGMVFEVQMSVPTDDAPADFRIEFYLLPTYTTTSNPHDLPDWLRVSASVDREGVSWMLQRKRLSAGVGLGTLYTSGPTNKLDGAWRIAIDNQNLAVWLDGQLVEDWRAHELPFTSAYIYLVERTKVAPVYTVSFDYILVQKLSADASVGVDITPPASSVDPIEPYWQTSAPFAVNATASDELSGVASVELYYRHSLDNETWGDRTSFGTSTEEPYSWSFNIPAGHGFYKFYTVATDVANNVEEPPADADAYCATPISATVDIDPDTLNLRSQGRWITAYIELPDGFDVTDIDVSTVVLEGAVSAELQPTEVGNHDGDGVSDLMVKFDRAAVQAVVEPGNEVELTVTGMCRTVMFKGTDTIRVIGSAVGESQTEPQAVTMQEIGFTVESWATSDGQIDEPQGGGQGNENG